MRKTALTTASAILAMTGAAMAIAGDKSKEEVPAVKTIGDPINCVQLRNIRSTDVIDGKTVDFRMTGGKTYRNTLPKKCPGLKFEESFSYRTSQARLCNVDIITVFYNSGASLQRGASCGLGKFQEIEKPKKKSKK